MAVAEAPNATAPRRQTGTADFPGGDCGARPSTRKLREIYVGQREVGRPTVLVVRDTGIGTEVLPRGAFDWGWPALGGATRLANALLLDLTGRTPPEPIRDRLAVDLITHLPWRSFSLTGADLLAWTDTHGYEITDWPAATTAVTPTPTARPKRETAQRNRGRRALRRGARRRTPPLAPRAMHAGGAASSRSPRS